MHEPTPDPRDAADVDPEAVNSALHYGLTSVFATDEPLPAATRRRGRPSLRRYGRRHQRVV